MAEEEGKSAADRDLAGRLRALGFSGRVSRDLLLSVLLCLLAFAAVAPGVLRYGMTWDEPDYFRFAKAQREWVGSLLSSVVHPAHLGALLRQETIAPVWLQHREYNGHPPLNELWMGLAGAPFRAFGASDPAAFRMAIALLFGLTALLLYRLSRLGLSRPSALAAVLAYAGIPAVWAHAHLGATETMQGFFWVLLAMLLPWIMRRGGRSFWVWLLAAALAFMAKFTNLLIPFWVLGTAGLFGALARRRFWICAGLALGAGPLLLTLIDPFFWPWQGGWARFLDYLRQTLTRSDWVPIRVFYMGKSWGFHPPWHYRLVEMAAALPTATLLLLPAGIWFSGRAAARAWPRAWRLPFAGTRDQGDGAQPRGLEDFTRAWPQVLGLTGLLFTVLIGWLPRTPNHDGTREFFYVFPSLALLVGTAVEGLVEGARRVHPIRLERLLPRWRTFWTALLFVLPTVALAESIAAEPWGLSYFSGWVGGTRGAWNRGFEVSYWCEAITPKMLARLGSLKPREDGVLRVHTLPKLNYFTNAGEFLDPFLPIGLRGRRPAAQDVMSAFYAGLARTVHQEARGLVLDFSFSTAPDAIMIAYRRATVSAAMWDFLDSLSRRGDLTLLEETSVGGVPLARLYAVNRLQSTRLPEDPGGIVWYQTPSVSALSSATPAGPPARSGTSPR